jgi:DNA-binding transcriptional regulator YiaG
MARAKAGAVSSCFAGHGLPRGPKVWHVSPEGFRELRQSCLLSIKGCACLLGCSPWTVRAWDRGQNRVPWSAVKLLRLFRLGDLGTLR